MNYKVNTGRLICREENGADAQRKAEMTDTMTPTDKGKEGMREGAAGHWPSCSQTTFLYFVGIRCLLILLNLTAPLV